MIVFINISPDSSKTTIKNKEKCDAERFPDKLKIRIRLCNVEMPVTNSNCTKDFVAFLI